MQIQTEIQQLVPDALIQLYELRPPASINLSPLRFTASGNGQPLTFQGQVYEPWAVEASGFESSNKGPVARPKLSISNVAMLPDGSPVRGLFTALVQQQQGLVGWTVIRRLTHARFLAGWPLADSPQMYPEEVWLINRREADDGSTLVFELRSTLDMTGRSAPGVLVTRYCPAHVRYRGPDCGYLGSAMFDVHDQPVTDPAQDACSKCLSGCRARGNLDNFAGFPGMRRYG